MSLTVGTLVIAETPIQAMPLRTVLGAYELVFALCMTIHRAVDMPMHAAIAGARVDEGG